MILNGSCRSFIRLCVLFLSIVMSSIYAQKCKDITKKSLGRLESLRKRNAKDGKSFAERTLMWIQSVLRPVDYAVIYHVSTTLILDIKATKRKIVFG